MLFLSQGSTYHVLSHSFPLDKFPLTQKFIKSPCNVAIHHWCYESSVPQTRQPQIACTQNLEDKERHHGQRAASMEQVRRTEC